MKKTKINAYQSGTRILLASTEVFGDDADAIERKTEVMLEELSINAGTSVKLTAKNVDIEVGEQPATQAAA
ncbi:MAG: hypothetical protein GY774_35255 [Planctomycetes bacterium]|nr:hypothetical protein [Planctomycetota bacterium]